METTDAEPDHMGADCTDASVSSYGRKEKMSILTHATDALGDVHHRIEPVSGGCLPGVDRIGACDSLVGVVRRWVRSIDTVGSCVEQLYALQGPSTDGRCAWCGSGVSEGDRDLGQVLSKRRPFSRAIHALPKDGYEIQACY